MGNIELTKTQMPTTRLLLDKALALHLSCQLFRPKDQTFDSGNYPDEWQLMGIIEEWAAMKNAGMKPPEPPKTPE